jgi:hypothetical protein
MMFKTHASLPQVYQQFVFMGLKNSARLGPNDSKTKMGILFNTSVDNIP